MMTIIAKRLIALGLLLCMGSDMAEAATPRRKVRLPPNELRVRQIQVEVKDVFDTSRPDESAWFYRMINALHARTRDHVILRELLIKPGSKATDLAIDESERNLRALSFVKSAEIERIRVSSGEADLIVRTQDSWTTQPQINFGSEGGQSKFEIGFVEENIMGFGKEMSYFYRDDPDEKEQELEYKDPQLWGTRMRLDSSFRAFTTGNSQKLAVQRPFFSIRTHNAWSVGASRDKHLEKLFENATETTRYNVRNSTLNGFYGRRLGEDPFIAHRLFLGYSYSENLYSEEARTSPGTLPKSRAFSGPLLRWQREPEDFIKDTFLDKAGRVEDVNLGHRATAESGYSTELFGATQNTVPITLKHSFGLGEAQDSISLFEYGMSGRYNVSGDAGRDRQLVHNLYSVAMNHYRHGRTVWPLTHIFHAEAAYMQRPDSDNLLELGGETGLRGFRNRAFTGNKTMLFNWETRVFYPDEILRLTYLGAAAFVDVGQAQPVGQSFRHEDFHTNIGVGLRIGLSRSSGGSVYRVDVAYALGKVPGSDRVIVSISSGGAFTRGINTAERLGGTSSF